MLRYFFLLALFGCGGRADVGGGDQTPACSTSFSPNFKIAYTDDTVPGVSRIWHSVDSSVSAFPFERVGALSYDGMYMSVIDGGVLHLFDPNGQPLRTQITKQILLEYAQPRCDGARMLVYGGGPNQSVDARARFGTLDEDGTYKELVVAGSVDAPTYAPDGSSLVFGGVSVDNTTFTLEIMRDDGSNHIILLQSNDAFRWPTFSFDGTRIVYARFGTDKTFGIGVMDLSSQTTTSLFSSSDVMFGYPYFTPDGGSVVYVRYETAGGQTSIERFDLSTQAKTTLLSGAGVHNQMSAGIYLAAD
jgi:hypothetical protein